MSQNITQPFQNLSTDEAVRYLQEVERMDDGQLSELLARNNITGFIRIAPLGDIITITEPPWNSSGAIGNPDWIGLAQVAKQLAKAALLYYNG